MSLILKYSLFAAFSTIVNLFFQFISFTLYSGFLSLYIAMFFGTIAGFITKYILDKNFIFYYQATSKIKEYRTIFFYMGSGIILTLFFWVFELFFYYFYQSDCAHYIGAAIGLCIGYFLKYHIDKNLTFKEKDE